MDQQKQTVREQWGISKQGLSRADRNSAAIVRKGITLQQIHGTKYAAEFLKEKEIDIEIIMRVLQNLSHQRRYDDLVERNDLNEHIEFGEPAGADAASAA